MAHQPVVAIAPAIVDFAIVQCPPPPGSGNGRFPEPGGLGGSRMAAVPQYESNGRAGTSGLQKIFYF
jgi:hypothetical protein